MLTSGQDSGRICACLRSIKMISFRMRRKMSEAVRTSPTKSEVVRPVPNVSERAESHSLTVKEVARLFEHAGVSRTEVLFDGANRTGRELQNWILTSIRMSRNILLQLRALSWRSKKSDTKYK